MLLIFGRVYGKSINQSKQTPKVTKTTEVVQVPQKEVKTPPAASVKVVEPTPTPVVTPKPVVVNDNACVTAMRQVFPADKWEVGEAIMRAESGLNPNALSGTGDRGCWQVNQIHVDMTSSLEAMFIPAENARLAYSISHQGTDWTGWTTYTSGKYLEFL